MGFYSTKTSEEKRVKQLTGDIHLSEEFKEEIKNRDIPIYQGYNIKSVYHICMQKSRRFNEK